MNKITNRLNAIADALETASRQARLLAEHIQRALLRVAVGNTKTPEDYARMVTKARGDYESRPRTPKPLRKLGDGLLVAYAMLVCAVSWAYRAQDRVLNITEGES